MSTEKRNYFCIFGALGGGDFRGWNYCLPSAIPIHHELFLGIDVKVQNLKGGVSVSFYELFFGYALPHVPI